MFRQTPWTLVAGLLLLQSATGHITAMCNVEPGSQTPAVSITCKEDHLTSRPSQCFSLEAGTLHVLHPLRPEEPKAFSASGSVNEEASESK